MKKLLALSVLLFAVATAYAQEQGKMEYLYCELVGTPNLAGTKVNVTIDLGQAAQFFNDKPMRDDKGKLVEFASVVDAINFMNAQGWELFQIYTAPLDNTSIRHFVLRKKMSSLDAQVRSEIEKQSATKQGK